MSTNGSLLIWWSDREAAFPAAIYELSDKCRCLILKWPRINNDPLAEFPGRGSKYLPCWHWTIVIAKTSVKWSVIVKSTLHIRTPIGIGDKVICISLIDPLRGNGARIDLDKIRGEIQTPTTQLGLNLKNKVHVKQCNHYQRRTTLTASVWAMRSFMNLNRFSTRVRGDCRVASARVLISWGLFLKKKITISSTI